MTNTNNIDMLINKTIISNQYLQKNSSSQYFTLAKMSAPYGIIYSLLFIAFAYGDDCDRHGTLIYEDLGCTPEFAKDKKCPIKYNCPNIPNDKKCHFKGKTYQNGETVESSLSSLSCNLGCVCVTQEERSIFRCAILDCPEWLGAPIKSDCYRKYSLDRCCSVGQVCSPFENIEKCIVGDKEYREGERFYPKNTCLQCVCQKGFTGKFDEPFCRKMSCGQQLKRFGSKVQMSCAPFYSKQLSGNGDTLCCPDDWICPDGSEAIKGESQSDETCKYGEKTLKVGQYFERSDITDVLGRTFKKMKCECIIPPFVKCVDM